MKHYLDNWLEDLYRSAFRLVYAHDGHVTRMIFIFLNIWWLCITLVPVITGGSSLWYGRTAQVAVALGLVNVINGFFLLLFRENDVLIRVHYSTTFLLAASSALYSLKDGVLNPDLGSTLAVAAICALSYVRYIVQSGKSGGIIMKKALIDVQQAYKLTPSPQRENGDYPYAHHRMDTR